MKISKEARRAARKLFRACFVDGRMEEERVRSAVKAVTESKPRHYLAILSAFERLVKSETHKFTMHVESSHSLDEARLREIQARVQTRFVSSLTASHSVNAALIGGLRLKVGSDVWDGSVAARLAQLQFIDT